MASAEYSVLTPERVRIQYDIAGIGSRGAAAIVDTLIQTLTLIVLFFALSATFAVGMFVPSARGSGAIALLVGLFSLALLVVTVGYFMLFEIIWSGQTPGKRLVGLRVIRENGYPIRPVDAVIRNLVRGVDWLPVLYGVGVLTMLLNKRSKRLGDFASGTIVVREGTSGGPGPVLLPTPTSPSGVTLANADATLVRDFLVRRESMNPHARTELARRLAAALAQRYSLSVPQNPETLLEQLS